MNTYNRYHDIFYRTLKVKNVNENLSKKFGNISNNISKINNIQNLNDRINNTIRKQNVLETDITQNLNDRINNTIRKQNVLETDNTQNLNNKINSTLNRNTNIQPKNEIPDSIVVTSKPIIFPVNGLTWTTTVNNPCNPTPWTITNLNQSIRYTISDSFNCGGTCNSIQSGTATASITAGEYPVRLYLDFYGIGELKDPNYEIIKIYLNDVEIANAHATGGGISCAFGPVTKEFITEPPYLLDANGVYKIFIDFTTNDALHHVGCYYQVDLSFEAILD
jgi:hypothetical protein